MDSFGLRLYDSSGNLQLDTSDRVPRIIYSFVITDFYWAQVQGASAGVFSYQRDVSVPGFSNDGTWGYTVNLYYVIRNNETLTVYANSASDIVYMQVWRW